MSKRILDSSGVRYQFPIPLDVMFILFTNFYRALEDEDIGFADCNNSIKTINDKMTEERSIVLSRADLEALLWSANMLEEKGEFWHPKKERLTDVVDKLLTKNEDFDYYYNLIKENKEDDI